MEEQLKKLNGQISRRLVKLANLQKEFDEKSKNVPSNQLLHNADLALLNANIVELKGKIADLSFERNDILRAMGKPPMPLTLPEIKPEEPQPGC